MMGNIGGGNKQIFNDTANDTIGGIVAMVNKEDNDRSETGGEDY